MTVLLLLLGCGPRWTETDAVAPMLARLDADGDGAVREAEYEAVRHRGAPFAAIDADGSGTLSADELLAIVAREDPAVAERTDGGQASPGKRRPPRRGVGAGSAHPVDPNQVRAEQQLVVRRILESLVEEVRAVAPEATLPDDEEVKRAAGSADIRTAECRAVLLRLETASDAAGIGFPAVLRAAALADVPVTPSFVPAEPPGPAVPAHPGVPPRAPGATGPRTPGGTP